MVRVKQDHTQKTFKVLYAHLAHHLHSSQGSHTKLSKWLQTFLATSTNSTVAKMMLLSLRHSSMNPSTFLPMLNEIQLEIKKKFNNKNVHQSTYMLLRKGDLGEKCV